MADKKKSILSDDSSDSEVDFRINEKYAHGYDKWRQGEELQKLKAKYGDESLSSSSSESEEEEIPTIEKNFLKTLSLLKSHDTKIYDENVKFFNESEKLKVKAKKPKPLFMKDYERKQLLERNGELSDEEIQPEISSTYDKEQQEIKESFKAALADLESDEESEEDFLQIRTKDDADKEKEEAEYIQWLKGEKDKLSSEDGDKDLKYLHDYWNDPNLDNDEQFLKDFILNKKFAGDDEDSDAIPTYNEITHDIGTLSDDEEVLEKQAAFEQKYNFRFEEPDAEFIRQYPRTIGDSLRTTDKKRKLKREEYKERKKQEKEQKREEIKRLKALKRAEIEEMVDKLKETTGDEMLNFDSADIEGDFDPDAHDKRMKELFNEDYYGVEETDKPEFSCDEEVDAENWDNWTGEDPHHYGEAGPHCEDPDFNMDADYNPKLEFQKQMIESQSKKSKKRKKSKFAEAVARAKPVFDPSVKKLEEYVDEYYNLDCEDVVGGDVFRFKYRNVVANDFGLSATEILKARDKELNKWCSLKKTCQYRNEEEESYDITAFQRKSQNPDTKKKIIPSLFEETEVKNPEASSEGTDKKPRKRKRKSKKQSNSNIPESTESSKDEIASTEPSVKRSKMEADKEVEEQDEISNDQKEISNDQEEISNDQEEISNDQEEISNDQEESTNCVPSTSKSHSESSGGVKKKKRKKKKKKPSDTGTFESKKPYANNAASKKQHNQSKGNMKNPYSNTNDKRLQFADTRLKVFAVNPKKFKNRIKYSKKAKQV